MAKSGKVLPVKTAVAADGLKEPEAWWRGILREPAALGLGALILVRPWLDGITYPTDNFYFVWGILLLFALWSAQVLLRGTHIRFGLPIVLLGGFWLASVVSALGTIQFDATYRALIVWGSHLCLFMLACNTLRTRTAIAIVLVAFVASSLMETVWSLVHVHYVLPYVRESVMRSPALLKQYFGTTDLSPELVHRLEVNRAFGSLLFPNALAALMIVGIPYAFVGSIHGAVTMLQTLRDARRAPRVDRASSMEVLLAAGLLWLGVSCVAYFLFSFITTFEIPPRSGLPRMTYLPMVYGGDSGYALDQPMYVALWLLFVLLPPLIAAGVGARIVRKYGLAMLGQSIRLWVLPPWFLLQIAALWLTYSRGGFMALAAASAMAAVLFFYRGRHPASKRAIAGVATAAVVICLMPAWHVRAEQSPATNGPSVAQSPATGAPGVAQPPAKDTPGAVPNHVAAAPAQADRPAQTVAAIRKEGVDLTMSDLANPASFKLRLGYWRTGLLIARHNIWSGVGLGNFGSSYARYQKPGVGDVKAAHNDYLQVLCETGIFGFLLFCGFWAWFVWNGARRILCETNLWERAILAGLYAGVVAFLLHAMVDFPFYNPALAFFVFLLAGAFVARSHRGDGGDAGPVPVRGRMQLFSLPMLACAALLAGMAARAFLCDFYLGDRHWVNVSNHQVLSKMYDATVFFVKETGAPQQKDQFPALDIIPVATLIPDRTVLESFGSIRVSTPGAQAPHRAIAANEPVPPNAFFVVTKPAEAKKRALEYIDLALSRIEEMDAVFPHNPDIATFFAQCYVTLVDNVEQTDVKQRYTLELLKWAKEGVRRSPEQGVFHEWLAKAYWLRGNIEPATARRPYYEQGLAEYKKATELYPIAPMTWRKYGNALKRFGEALKNGNNPAEAEAYLAKGQEAMQKAGELEQAIAALR